VLIMGASGGDMAMAADLAQPLGLSFPPPSEDTSAKLRQIVGDRVTIANPFDFHTYVWFDWPAMRALFSTVLQAGYDAVGFVLDSPPEGTGGMAAFEAAIDQFIAAASGTPARAVLIASLPETLGQGMRRRCLSAGVVPLQGQREALEALNTAGAMGECWRGGSAVALARPAGLGGRQARTLSEPEGKAALASAGVRIPASRTASTAATGAAAATLGFPVAIKVVSADLAHKSDAGGVVLNVRTGPEAEAAVQRLGALSPTLLVEEMIDDGVVEVLVGMVVDPQFGLTLVLGAGGVLTELLQDTVSLLPPFSPATIASALQQLKIAPLLRGFRGRPPADVPALVELILAVTRFATARLETLVEMDVNPVIVRPVNKGAVAVDAMIRLRSE
jgi:acetyl-CoA synthetase